MSSLVIILIVVVTLKFFLFGGILWAVFRTEIKAWMRKPPPPQPYPACMYCGSVYTHREDEGQVRWENEQLVLVSMYVCEHCRLPFWHVERVPVGDVSSARRQHDKI